MEQNNAFRKTVFIIVSILFTGGLMVWTGLANLKLLSSAYPDPQFVGFGMLCLEGGVIYWVGAYLLHWMGTHKGIAVVMIVIDALFSLTGFFIEVSHYNQSTAFTQNIPAIPVILAIDVTFNVGMGWLIHLLPDHTKITKETFSPLVNGAREVVGSFQRKKDS